jgi:hypothetical protein
VKDLQNFLFCLARIEKGGNFSTKPQSISQEQKTPFNKHTSLLQPNAITHRRLPITTTTATLQQNCLKQNSSFSPSLVKNITYTAKHRDQNTWSIIANRLSNLCSKHPKPKQEEDEKQQQRQATGNGKNRRPKNLISTKIRDFQTSPDSEIARATHNVLQRIKSSKNDYQKSNQWTNFISSIAKLLFLEEEGKHNNNNNNNKAKPVLKKTCSPNFLPRAALESAMQSERESLERARAWVGPHPQHFSLQKERKKERKKEWTNERTNERTVRKRRRQK